MNEFMNERPRDPTPLELFGRLAGAVQTIAEALNTDHPGHPCHGLAGRVEAVLLGMQGPRPIGLGSVPAGPPPGYVFGVDPAHPIPSAASSTPACCNRDHNGDGNCDRHPTAPANPAPAAKSNISPDDVIDPNWKPAPEPVKQTTGDDGA